MKKLISILFAVWILCLSFLADPASSAPSMNLNNLDQDKIDNLVNATMQKAKVPGVSIVLVQGNQTKSLNYGYADRERSVKVDESTLFELGSMSKAYTAAGILLLEQQGRLSLQDSVRKYIPSLKVHYDGEYSGQRIDADVDLKLSNLLHHTSGISPDFVGYIPEGSSEDMLEKTVNKLINTDLLFYPGSKFQYSTINYDVLALVIQNITGQTYEEFMLTDVLLPLGLKDTHMFRDDNEVLERIAQGYKFNYFRANPYEAPTYRGNTAAGYIVSSIGDMERWLRIQLGLIEVDPAYQMIIDRSHTGDTTVASQGDYYYAGGWNVHIRGENITHGGSNPNFSSMLIMEPENQLGICVLANLNSNASEYLAANILNLIEGKKIDKYTTDQYKKLDTVFSWVTYASVIIIVIFFILLVKAFIEAIQKKRTREKTKTAILVEIAVAIPLMMFCGFCVYYLPNILFQRLPWKAVNVWGSPAVSTGCILGFIAAVIFMTYVVFTFNLPKRGEKNYVALIALTFINGIASALIIFTINESFNRNLEYSKELLVYFIFSLVFFVYTIKLVQGKMIVITNELAYEKRMTMIDKIMGSTYQTLERVGKERLFSGLNNDTNAVSELPGVIINLASNLLTLVFCLSYLLSKSVYAFGASISIIIVNGVISAITGRAAAKFWDKNRDIQDTYFGQISDLIYGFKELVLNKFRKYAFWQDMKHYSRLSADLNKTAALKVLNFNLYNTLMYNIVFGVVVFVFPIIILSINVNDLRENLFIVFYMIGPFGGLADAIPRISRLRVNVKRIDTLIGDLGTRSGEMDSKPLHQEVMERPQSVMLQFDNVKYKYSVQEEDKEEEFCLGPISATFKTGEITFITGGNGSGKSTLGKLITGLYQPQEGRILLDGKNTGHESAGLNESFCAIYTDFHLFNKLYGLNYEANKEQVDYYLKLMKINSKIQISDAGEFASLKLSTGQKKRLAFVISCVENKPMMLFDEWAAEQDPEFRRFFYEELLPMLKAMGKGVIVITHDDRYFDKADNLLRLERGTLVYTNSLTRLESRVATKSAMVVE